MDEAIKKRIIKVDDNILKTIEEDYSISKLTNKEFNEVLNSNLWGDYITNVVNGHHNKLEEDFLYKAENCIKINFSNELVDIFKDLRQNILNKVTENYIIKTKENLVITSEEFKKYQDKVGNILVANNINIISSLLNKVTVKENKDYYDGLNMGIVSFLQNIEKFETDNKKGIGVNSFTYNTTKYAVKEVNNIRSQGVTDLIGHIHQIRRVINYFKTVKFTNNKGEKVLIEDNLLLLQRIIEDIDTFDNDIIKKVGSNIMMILPSYKKTMDRFIKNYYDNSDGEITKANLLDTDENIDIFKKNIREFIDTDQFIHKSTDKNKIDKGQKIKHINLVETNTRTFTEGEGYDKKTIIKTTKNSNLEQRLKIISIQLDFLDNRTSISTLTDEKGEISSKISTDKTGGKFELGSNMDAKFFKNILEKEIFQKKGYKCDLSLKERIILGMMYDSFFKLGEAYYLLQDYFEGEYPKTFIQYIGQFGFYECPTKEEIYKSTKLNDYWKQYFRDTLDAVKVSNITKIFKFGSETSVTNLDLKIKEKLNNAYEVMGSDGEYILHFYKYEYQKNYTESKKLKESYRRYISKEDSDNMEDIIRDMIEIRKGDIDKIKGNYLKNYSKLDNKEELKRKIKEKERLRLEKEREEFEKITHNN